MTKVQKSVFIVFISVLVQTVLGLSVGLGMLYISSRDHINDNVYIGNTPLGNLNREEAAAKVEEMYKATISNGSFTIIYGSNKKFLVKYSEIDAFLDIAATIRTAFGSTGSESFENMIRGHFSSQKREITPVITFNEGKLREKLNELAIYINKEPVDADIEVKEGKVVKIPEEKGLKLNFNKSLKRIESEIGKSIGGFISFREADDLEVETIAAEYTLSSYDGLNEIISQHTTKVLDLDVADSLIQAAFAINKVCVPCADLKNRKEPSSFSFNKYLVIEGGIINKNDEGYNQVASTLYAAVLKAGIDPKFITRTPHKNTVDYIQPGLDAVVISNTYDFKFVNTLDSPVLIYTEIHGDTLTVSIISKKKQSQVTGNLETEVIQKYTPTVEYVENEKMAAGERKMVSSGREGLLVKVYRTVPNSTSEDTRRFLYEDRYEAVKAIIEIGPNTRWGDDSIK
ncbi:MAG: VanW family protein [Clostridia bacterium]|nr:VanW family protein [Clostridia bacterium]